MPVGRGVAAAAAAAVTCLIIWLARFVMPTEGDHGPGQTYLPDGLYLATVASLGLAFAATVLIDRWVVAKSLSAAAGFAIGFGVGVVLFLIRLPWIPRDGVDGKMFSLFDWWIAPILGVVCPR